MKISLADRQRNTLDLGLIYGGITIFILLSVHITTLYLDLHHLLSDYYPCVFKRITHLPCLTCGGTRATTHLAHLRIPDAFQMNPLVTTGLIALLLWGLYSCITFITRSKRVKIHLTKVEGRLVIYLVIGLLLINWFYLIFIG